MGLRGPLGKSAIELKLHGGRKDRIAQREKLPVATGTPVMPADLKGEAAKEWKRVCDPLVEMGIVGAIDTSLLAATCKMYALYRASDKLAEQMPTQKDVRCAVTGYYASYLAGVTKLGLSPLDRGRVKTDKPAGDKPKVAGFSRQRG